MTTGYYSSNVARMLRACVQSRVRLVPNTETAPLVSAGWLDNDGWHHSQSAHCSKHVFSRVVHGPSQRPLSLEFCTVDTTDKTKQDDIDVTLTPRRRNAGQNPFGPFHL